MDFVFLAELSAGYGLALSTMMWLFELWQKRRSERHTNAS
jgi:hypothetical protein